MTLDRVRKLLLRKCKPFISGRGNSQTGIRPWCEAHGVASTHASEFVTGKRGPAPDLLQALGLEWRIMPKRRSRSISSQHQSPPTGE